ncbi:toxin-antitoxin system YwqK family antitoxin [Algibacter miyuki]|uniref:Toxin-antitoxin system YwqK family antitoxin n=1 Tax=Algibacter miyuki TaxID=1306933 RepID=A0ABV5GZ30_9FLAO|nr:toxin-antitoxin system YwqK family antitoxin [Algibacter miyuki]MDN3667071.1 toxin-antitoxin system YwqK family antitoxin [Algibacter miyuki]
MKFLTLILLLIFSCSCKEQTGEVGLNKTIPESYVLKSEATQINGVCYMNDSKYSGYLYQLEQKTADTILVESYYEGLQEGVSKKWYTGNRLKEIRYYSEGMKNGQQVAFWENGNKRFEYTAQNDGYEGELKEWNETGFLLHLANYKNGQEEGTQKMWYDNGKIRANYVIVEGKRFGLLGTKNCVNVSDSIFFNN